MSIRVLRDLVLLNWKVQERFTVHNFWEGSVAVIDVVSFTFHIIDFKFFFTVRTLEP